MNERILFSTVHLRMKGGANRERKVY